MGRSRGWRRKLVFQKGLQPSRCWKKPCLYKDLVEFCSPGTLPSRIYNEDFLLRVVDPPPPQISDL